MNTSIFPRVSNGEPTAARPLPVAFGDEPECSAADTQRILAAALSILDQGASLLRALSDESYSRRVPVVFNASIGGHYRHCLDHFSSLLGGLDADEVDYDHRKRDPRIETQAGFALARTAEIRASLGTLTAETLCAGVKARCEVSYEHGGSPVTRSTLAREMAYCIAHAIHHYALIAVMARLMEVRLPEDFGVAPSTVAHQRKVAATQSA